MKKFVLAIIAALVATPAIAQDFSAAEIVVTGSRVQTEEELFDDYNSERPAVGLIKRADFLVQQVVIRGDTRDPKLRGQEIRKMLDSAIALANRYGVELAFGEYILTPLSAENSDELTLQRDSRPDSSLIKFQVKASLAGDRNGAEVQTAIERFIEGVPEVGRAQMDSWGDATLSIIGPDRYRYEITAKIAEDAKRLTQQLGDGYSVQIVGLNKPVQWARSGLSDVQLYIPYILTVLPTP